MIQEPHLFFILEFDSLCELKSLIDSHPSMVTVSSPSLPLRSHDYKNPWLLVY